MTTIQEGESLTRVGPGTPMGNLMREYWIPALKSSELVADGAPVRLMLLGEKLLAFRDTSGRVGVMDHRCPHRCASLFFGRNEEDGLRCVYHGWKFDVDGKCLDMPNVPKHQQFTEQVTAKTYKAVERAGMVWAYMGNRAVPPPMPVIEATLLDADDVRVNFVQRECNWLQALEGDIDTSHATFLHYGADRANEVKPTMPGANLRQHLLSDRAPEYHIADTDWGTMYAAYRPGGPGELYWRVAQFLFPCWAMTPAGTFSTHVIARGWIPMDDTHTMHITMMWKGHHRPPTGTPGTGGRADSLLPNGTGWHDRYRLRANVTNDYEIDREVQRDRSYTGIEGIGLQDTAVTESMGAITDHGFEHLASSDRMIMRTRQRMLMAVRAHQEGVAPPGVDNPDVFAGARSGDFVAPATQGWLEAYGDQVRNAQNPTGALNWKAAAE